MNVFNIKTNSKLYRYFNGKNKNVLATILAFDTINVSAFTSHPDSLSSEIKKAKINELKLENKHLNIKIEKFSKLVENYVYNYHNLYRL